MRRILPFLLLVSVCAQAQKAPVRTAPKSLFGFNPLSNSYAPHNLAPIATYTAAWRKEQPDLQLLVSDSLLDPATKYYLNNIDTTLYHRILTHLTASVDSSTQPIQDSTLYTFPASRELLQAFDTDVQKIRRFFATPLATLDSAKTFDPYAPSTLSQYMHHFQIAASGADLSLWAPPRLNAALNQEPYAKEIFYLYRYENQLVVVQMSGKEVKELLEQIYARRFYALRSAQSDLLNFRLPPSMHQSVAGVAYKYELTKRKIEAPTLDQTKIYKVAMNSYAASKLNKAVRKVGDYNTLLINHIRNKKTGKNSEQWRLAPERWVGEIKAREVLFFPAK